MSLSPCSLRLTGATVLRDGTLQNRSVALEDGRITKGPLPEVDLRGYYILPGIIDLHGDAFERHLAPRPSAPFPIGTALRATDHDAAANGITTAWMAHSWSWEGGFRGPEHCEAFLQAVEEYTPHALTDLRVQIRCETHTVDSGDRLLSAIRRHHVDYVVFNNHLDEALHLAARDPEQLGFWARKSGFSLDTHLTNIRRLRSRSGMCPGICAASRRPLIPWV